MLAIGPAALARQPATAAAGTLSQRDRDAGIESLTRTQQELLQASAGLSAAQWSWKPAPDRWSIAEVTEHLTLAEPALLKMITEIIASPTVVADNARIPDARVFEFLLDRTVKNKAPEELSPKGQWRSRDDQVNAFLAVRARTIAYLRTTREDLRAHGMASAMGMTDAFQWFLYISGHTARHIAQIEEVKRAPNYPQE
ncbi:MAG TPA: DinB family protein [Thermoanaerobaculia bacterium]|nr:DinB family protein [Thermoanaerobaculia bacterium]